MRIMALDVGSKRIGVALSDPLKITAQGLQTFQRTALEEDVKGLWQLIDEHEVSQLVVGLPKNMDGTQGFQSQYSLDFKAMLEEELKLPVIMLDERLTTRMAHNTMLQADMSRKKRKQNVDKIAATIILQSYLDSLPKY